MITIDPPSTSSNSSPAKARSLAGSLNAGPSNPEPSKTRAAKRHPIEPPLSKSGLTRFLNRARTAVGLTGQVEVLLTTDAELRRLNRTFRGKNKPTDVLSFPTPLEISAHHAGDLAISLDTAARQAQAFGHTLRDEVRVLLLHGLLHLSGLDHEIDHGEMADREAQLRAELRLPTSLIARVSAKPKSKPKATGKSLPKPPATRRSHP